MTGFESNVVELTALRTRRLRLVPELRSRPGDQRTFPRREVTERLFIQVVVCPADPRLAGSTFSASAADMSASGLRVRGPRALPIGTLVDLWIDIQGRAGKFFLAGEVRWTDLDDTGHIVGIELRHGAATDIAEWREFNIDLLVKRR